ncbi:hypothetical protein [Sodalis sp. RH20]|uniref:hypothetical protein n=1 Tax=unclassified Sodalis (in: enterobacteria) TaxID=2636512 RepID=UPI0039B5AE70
MAYWRTLREKINTYSQMNAAMDKPTADGHYPSPPDLAPVNPNPNRNNMSRHHMMLERNQWLHTFGVSQEFPAARDNVTLNFVDMMLSDLVQRKYGLSLTAHQLSRKISLLILFMKHDRKGMQPTTHIKEGIYSVRQLLLKEFSNAILNIGNNAKEDNDYIIIKTTILGSDKENFLSYLEFIINGDAITLTAELERLLEYFGASTDISAAYITMAKNRMVAALFPFMASDADRDLRNMIDRWMDGLIGERLISVATPEGRFTVPGIVAIAEPTGGLFISLATGRIYLWTPDDASTALKHFIAGHLSIQHKAWLESTSLTPRLNKPACILESTIVLINQVNIWERLRHLDMEKLDEHIGYNALVSTNPNDAGPDDVTQQRLLAASNAISLLALFFSGGSPAGCAAMILGDMLAGAGSVLQLQSAAREQDAQRRQKGWESALLSIVITGITGAADIYGVIKSYGSQGYALLHEQAGRIGELLKSATTATQVAETFTKGETRDRMVMLVKALVNEEKGRLNILGNNNIKAMLQVFQLCRRIDDETYQFANELYFWDESSSPKIILRERESLRFIPPGYKVAVVDNLTNKLTLLLLSLGNDRFAGFGLQKLDHSLSASQWQEVGGDAFIMNNQQLILKNGRSATLYVEDYNVVSTSTLDKEIFSYDDNLALRFRRYCNRFKFEGNLKQALKGVERFAINHGFYNVRYRALFIFDPIINSEVIRHYLLAAKYKNIDYLLEPNAENLRSIKLPDIEDVAILTEDKWTLSFKNSGSAALITYKDFATEQLAQDYQESFMISRDNEQLLLSPPGFSELLQPATPITFSTFLSHYDGVEQQLLLQKKIRKSIIKDQTSKNSYEFIISVMQKAGQLTLNQKDNLLAAYKKNSPEAMLEIIPHPFQIRTYSDMLRIEPGKLVRFTNLQDSSISHLMLSVGNGRFTGMNNSLLDAELSDEKCILITEQLGHFKDDVLVTYNQCKSFMVEKGDFPHSSPTSKSIMDIAKELSAKSSNEKTSIRFALEILIAAKHLVPQQADALERLARLMIGKMDGNRISIIKLNKFMVIDKYIDNNAQLANVAAGKLLVFYTDDKDFHMMVSLGDDRFAGLNNDYINNMLRSDQRIVSSQEIGDITNGRRINDQKSFKVVVGEGNLEKNRISALLGPDGRIDYVRNGLNSLQMEIKAHGALASINHYDAVELSNIILGLHRSLHPDQPISHIELISCFGALGGRRSSAQIMADRLGATVESYRGVITDSKSRNRGTGVMFKPQRGCGIERRRDNERWHRRIHDFIEDALSLIGNLPFQRHSRAVSENIPFGMVVIDVLHFLRKEIGAQTLMAYYPGLMTAESLYQASLLANPTGDEETLIAAMLTIFYGSRTMSNALDAYILSREYKEMPAGTLVVDGQDLRHPLHWRDVLPSLDTFRQLPSIVVSRNLLSKSNIYISLTDDKDHLREYLIRLGSECHRKTLWPLLLANFFKEKSAFFPIMAGVRDQDILSMGFDFSHFHFYLNSWLRSDFSLQIDMTTDEPRLDPIQPAHYVHFSETGGRRTDTRDDIGLGHSLLVEQVGRLALQMNETLIVDRPGGPDDGENNGSTMSPLPSTPRVVITLLENRERLVMLQRNIPSEIFSDQGEIAFFIATEVNKYTETIKLGAKDHLDIRPVKSNSRNFIYGDPGILQKSWILINLIHND